MDSPKGPKLISTTNTRRRKGMNRMDDISQTRKNFGEEKRLMK